MKLGARERRAVTGKVRYGGFAKATSNQRGPDDRGQNGACRAAAAICRPSSWSIALERGRRLGPNLVGSSPDSPLEGAGFELGPTFVCSAAFGVKKAPKPRSSCRGLLALGVSPTHRGSKGDSNPRSHLRGAHNRRSFGRASERGIPPTRRSRSYSESSGASHTLLQRRAEPWCLNRRRQHGNFGSQTGEGEKRWLETG